MDTYGEIILLIILIGLSGFFSASETALTAFKSNELEDVEDEHPKVAELLKRWLKKPNEMLTGILLGNNIVNVLASSIATAVTFALIGTSGKAIAMVTLLMTLIILIFGEITPKVVAKNNSSKVAVFVILPIYYLSKLTLPIIKVLMFISKLIGKIFGIHISDENMMITEEDIISYVNVGEAEGVIEEDEKEMIHSIFEFGETSAKEVMTPRTSMFALEADETIDEVWDIIRENGFSRIPVYDEEGKDNIIGILYIKDLLDVVKGGKTDVPIGKYVRKPYFVPETKSIMEILEDFKKMKVHIAIALDEYGGTSGLLTIEDLIEEIVGEIQDEYDNEEDELIKKVSENTYEIDAMIDIETLNKELDLEIEESEDYESLGGFIVTETGKVAEKGDYIEVGNIEIKVLEVDKMRVSKVLLVIKSEVDEDDE